MTSCTYCGKKATQKCSDCKLLFCGRECFEMICGGADKRARKEEGVSAGQAKYVLVIQLSYYANDEQYALWTEASNLTSEQISALNGSTPSDRIEAKTPGIDEYGAFDAKKQVWKEVDTDELDSFTNENHCRVVICFYDEYTD